MAGEFDGSEMGLNDILNWVGSTSVNVIRTVRGEDPIPVTQAGLLSPSMGPLLILVIVILVFLLMRK